MSFIITEQEVAAKAEVITLRILRAEAYAELYDEGVDLNNLSSQEYEKVINARIEEINKRDEHGYAANIILDPKNLRETAIEEIAEEKALAVAKAVGKDPSSLLNKCERDTNMGEAEYTPEENREAEQELRTAMDAYRAQAACNDNNAITPFTAEALEEAIIKIKNREGQPICKPIADGFVLTCTKCGRRVNITEENERDHISAFAWGVKLDTLKEFTRSTLGIYDIEDDCGPIITCPCGNSTIYPMPNTPVKAIPVGDYDPADDDDPEIPD